MFNGSVPIILDSLKQHYFIDRDGKLFRHTLNFLRTAQLWLPDDFKEVELLLEEARFYEIQPMVKAVEEHAARRRLQLQGPVKVKKERVEDGEGVLGSTAGHPVMAECECVVVNISPDLGERISLSADRALLEEVFPELTAALMDSRNAGWNLDNRWVIRFPVNGFCKLNSLQVLQRLLQHGFSIAASNGGGVEGQQFSEYLFYKRSCAAGNGGTAATNSTP